MTTTPPDTSPQGPPHGQPHGQAQGPAPDSGPRVGWDDIRDLARIRRSRSDRRVAGIAGGLGRHLDVDPVILRVAFVVLTFFGGVGLLLYLALWLLVPEDGSDWARIKLDRRSRTAALIIVGVLAGLLLVSHGWWGSPGPFFWLVIVAAIIVLALQLPRRSDRPTPPPPGAPQPGAHQTGAQQPGGQPYAAGEYVAPYAEPDAQPFAQASVPPYAPPYADAPAPTQNYPAGYPPPSYTQPEQPRPVNPRKKGPILFWFALGTMAVALGALGIVDLAGADVAPSAYPATALGLSAAFLLLGSFFGRAGGIIMIGLVAAAVTVGTTVADHWNPRSTTEIPRTAAAVQPEYTMDVGEIRLDLTEVRDLQALDGREITIDGNVGHLEVRVPPGLSVVSEAHVTGVGGITSFGRDAGGFDTSLTTSRSAGAGAPHLTIVTDLSVGGIEVRVGLDR